METWLVRRMCVSITCSGAAPAEAAPGVAPALRTQGATPGTPQGGTVAARRLACILLVADVAQSGTGSVQCLEGAVRACMWGCVQVSCLCGFAHVTRHCPAAPPCPCILMRPTGTPRVGMGPRFVDTALVATQLPGCSRGRGELGSRHPEPCSHLQQLHRLFFDQRCPLGPPCCTPDSRPCSPLSLSVRTSPCLAGAPTAL